MTIFKKTKLTRMLFFMLLDAVSVSAAIWLAFMLRFDGAVPEPYYPFLFRLALAAMVSLLAVFYVSGRYSFSWSYVSASDIAGLFVAVTATFAVFAGVVYVSAYFPGFENFPRSVIVIGYVLTLVFVAASRFAKRIWMQESWRWGVAESSGRTLIVGAGDAGEQTARSMQTAGSREYAPVGFVDDHPLKQGVSIHGIPVLGMISAIPAVVPRHRVKKVVIALPSSRIKSIRQAVDLARRAGVRKIKIVPSIDEVVHGGSALKRVRDVDAEDLLGRGTAEMDAKQVQSLIRQKRVLITGAAGSIGSELSRQVAGLRPELLVLLDQDETGVFTVTNALRELAEAPPLQGRVASVSDEAAMDALFAEFRPQVVLHAAAYKHVPLMELQPEVAVKNNVLGTWVVANAAVRHGAEKCIFISTDKAVNPTSVMGATKRLGEMICQAASGRGATQFVSVRFGNVLNSRGSVIPLFKEQIRRGGPVEVTHPDMRRYFMLISEACRLVLQAGAMGRGGEVLVLDMGKPVSILDLAREMIRLSGFEPDRDIAIVITGMRPGEKLFEEMLTAEEGVQATFHQSIFAAKLSPVDAGMLESSVARLAQMAERQDRQGILELFGRLIPSYRPKTVVP